MLRSNTSVSGVTRVTLNLQAMLPKPNTTLIVPESIADATLAHWAKEAGATYLAAPALRPEDQPGNRLSDFLGVVRLCRSAKARTVNIHYGGTHFSIKDALAVRLSGASYVPSLHNTVKWTEVGNRRKLMTKLASFFATTIIVCNAEQKSILTQAGVKREKIEVIPGGVAEPTPVAKDYARTTLGIGLDRFVIGFIGRISPEKNLPALIAAVDTAPTDFVLCLKDDVGPERDDIVRKAKAMLGHRFVLAPPDTANDLVYSAVDILCLPSFREGMPLVLMEAALHGLPVVSTPVGGIPDLVLDGVTGILVQPTSVEDLSLAIQFFGNHPLSAHRFGAAAYEHAHKYFTRSTMAERYRLALGYK